MRRLLADISWLLAEPILELLVGRWTDPVSHGHHRFLLLLWLLRRLLLNNDLFFNNWFAILVLLILVHNVAARVEIFLTLITPSTLNAETLVIYRSEPTCLGNTTKIIISETQRSILECSLIIFLALIRLSTWILLKLWLWNGTSISAPAFTLIVFSVNMSAHYSLNVWWLMSSSTI